ncbi:MAG: mechanosensitive ion channel family protein, partial [Alphaproteobacteria bacterium]|nr:mechanosensitive ion channel family protein [Alphaproteobacteria bacterium]
FAAASLWFDGGHGVDALGRSLAMLPATWWAAMTPVAIVLRPSDSTHRLVPLGDRVARLLHRVIAALLALRMTMVAMLPTLIVHGNLPVPAAQAVALGVGTTLLVLGALAASRLWRLDCAERGADEAGFWRRVWPAALLAIVALLWWAWTSGVLAVDLALYDSLIEALTILVIAFVSDRVLALLERERGAKAVDGDATLALLRAARRCVRVVAVVVAFPVVLRILAVEQLDLVGAPRWSQALPALRTATFALVLGYAAWEALRFWVDRRLGPQGPSLPGEDEELDAARSRFDTLLPLLRITGGIAIGVITVLFALTELGVNTTPLLAGASILGLAISFGSQSLVRDIVSGVFFMLDDAFRIGDYIDTGRLKGTVEGISLRSIRLRHQNGQVHTIPFGQLQAITNFSRDWATMKFNLRLARDSDIEAVRKAVKKIGQEMLTDPELAREFIQPLKLQGVQEIDETAIVVRCKFTVRPAKPTWVQRQALRRIHEAFPRLGIQFATPSVTVHGASGDAALADAAARQHAVTATRRPATEG